MYFKTRNKKAFTLIEIIVVIAVIAILALLAMPRIQGHLEKARVAHIQHDSKVLEDKMDEYLVSHGEIKHWMNAGPTENQLYSKEGRITAVEVNFPNGFKVVEKTFYPETNLPGTFYTNVLGEVIYEDVRSAQDSDQEESSDEGYFEFDPPSGTITDFYPGGKDGDLPTLQKPVIPGTIDGEKVTTIGEGAFSGKDLTGVVLPGSITNISDNAFSNNKITEVVLPGGIVIIGEGAFKNNGSYSTSEDLIFSSSGKYVVKNDGWILEDISETVYSDNGYFRFDAPTQTITDFYPFGMDGTLPELRNPVIPAAFDGVNVLAIGDMVFYRKELTGVTLPYGVVTIGREAFSNNENIGDIKIPDTVTYIGESAFSRSRVTSLALGSGVREIAKGAFFASRLKDLTIPDNVEIIGDGAFQHAIDGISTGISSVSLGNGVKTIGGWAFRNNAITNIVIPDSVITIGDEAFHSNGLVTVTFGSGVKNIGRAAFAWNSLQSVDIPYGVTIIEKDTFYRNGITNIVIPGSVTTIGDEAFQRNGLSYVYFPESVESVSGNAFGWNGDVGPSGILDYKGPGAYSVVDGEWVKQ